MSMILSFSNWSTANKLNESIKDSKIYLEKNSLTSDEDKQAFQSIIDLLGSAHGYVYPFVLFHFKHGILIEDLTVLWELIRDNAGVLNKLPKTIIQYAKSESNGFNNLVTTLNQLIQDKGALRELAPHKWIIEQVTNELRNKIKQDLPEDQIRELYQIAQKIDKIDSIVLKKFGEKLDDNGQPTNNKINFLKNSDAYRDQPASAYFERAKEYIKGIEESAYPIILEKAENQGNAIKLVYDEGGYVAFIVRTEAAQMDIFSMATWCINRGHWNNYGGRQNGVQINIFNFNLPITDIMFLTGTTASYDDGAFSIQTSHAKNNDAIGLRGKSTAKHFEKLGYPTELINAVDAILPSEILNKQANEPITVRSLLDTIKSSYSIAAANSEDFDTLLITRTINSMNSIPVGEIVNFYRANGILSVTAANVLKAFIDQNKLDATQIDEILEKNREIVDRLKTIYLTMGREYSPKLTNTVESQNRILSILG
jgi:hypothetical protein